MRRRTLLAATAAAMTTPLVAGCSRDDGGGGGGPYGMVDADDADLSVRGTDGSDAGPDGGPALGPRSDDDEEAATDRPRLGRGHREDGRGSPHR